MEQVEDEREFGSHVEEIEAKAFSAVNAAQEAFEPAEEAFDGVGGPMDEFLVLEAVKDDGLEFVAVFLKVVEDDSNASLAVGSRGGELLGEVADEVQQGSGDGVGLLGAVEVVRLGAGSRALGVGREAEGQAELLEESEGFLEFLGGGLDLFIGEILAESVSEVAKGEEVVGVCDLAEDLLKDFGGLGPATMEVEEERVEGIAFPLTVAGIILNPVVQAQQHFLLEEAWLEGVGDLAFEAKLKGRGPLGLAEGLQEASSQVHPKGFQCVLKPVKAMGLGEFLLGRVTERLADDAEEMEVAFLLGCFREDFRDGFLESGAQVQQDILRVTELVLKGLEGLLDLGFVLRLHYPGAQNDFPERFEGNEQVGRPLFASAVDDQDIAAAPFVIPAKSGESRVVQRSEIAEELLLKPPERLLGQG